MNISYKWLKNYLNLTEDAEQVAKNLTSIGLEVGTVEEVQTIKGGLKGLVIGEVLTCEEHPNSDHLHITTVTVAPNPTLSPEGAREIPDFGKNPLDPENEAAWGTPENPLQIVCGAPNCRKGLKVIVATLGTVLYDGEESFQIKKSKIRGVESFGMLCAEDEIGVGNSHDGIIELPLDVTVGTPAAEYYHLENDSIIEVDITPNRSDACSHFGVARDLYAFYKAQGVEIELKRPAVDAFKVDDEKGLEMEVEVVNKEAAPRYSGVCISGVEVKDSPEWLQNALRTIGLRPINNIVDATNYVLHEMGQALHAFDYDKIKGHKIVVKTAEQGQKFVTLDGVEREMNEKDLMIWNAEEPMCIAGVFGGQDSGVTETTKNVFLESAYFEPVSIRKTARRHQLSTDASFRYERGCDPLNTINVMKRCALLIQEVAGGKIASQVFDIQSATFEPFKVTLEEKRCNTLIGKKLGAEKIETILKALEINITAESTDADGLKVWEIEVPRYRTDVQRDCDVIEDVLRIYGYNNVELSESLHSNLSFTTKPDSVALQRRISEQLSAQGFNEILNNSLTKVAYYENNEVMTLDTCVKVMNPLSQDLGVMRQTLLFGGLESIARNNNRKNFDLRFYEFGNNYHYNAEKRQTEVPEGEEPKPLKPYSEETHLGIWLTGSKTAQSWVGAQEKMSFYTLRAYAENVMRRMGVHVDRCSYEPFSNQLYSDGLMIIAPNKKVIGQLCIVDRKLRKQFDIDNDVYYADFYWEELLKQNKMYKAVITDLPKFPEVKRDLALLVDKKISFAELLAAARQTEKKLLKDVYLFDVYEGKNLEEGKKSYALSFIIQDTENTLKDNQIEAIMQKLQKAFEQKFNAKLR
ncbi:MAG: phenylalanine--tRNA ligase subunit beta [Bacteroidales bacterium]|nr:phenylalanine--tRNA ligase subunit beta [Candidatus Colicola faecequi]